MKDKKAFAKRLGRLAATLRSPQLTEEALDGYWSALADLDWRIFDESCLRAEREATFLPVPSELRRLGGAQRTDNPRPTPVNGFGNSAHAPPPEDPTWAMNRARAREMVNALVAKFPDVPEPIVGDQEVK